MVINNLENLIRDFIIVDTHVHLGPLSNLYMPSGSNSNIIKLLKKFGVKKAICATHSSLSTINFGSVELPSILEEYKDFLYGYFVFNPNFEEISLKTLENYLNKNLIAGVKIHPSWHFCYPFDKKYAKFWDFITERQIPVLTHSWDPDVPNKAQKFSDPFFFEDIIKKHPSLKLILAHAGGRGEMLFKVISLLENYTNLYVDFAGDIFVPGLIEEYVKRVGSKRLLFGTDMPWVDIRFQLANVMNLDIDENDKRNILGLNAIKLFNLKI